MSTKMGKVKKSKIKSKNSLEKYFKTKKSIYVDRLREELAESFENSIDNLSENQSENSIGISTEISTVFTENVSENPIENSSDNSTENDTLRNDEGENNCDEQTSDEAIAEKIEGLEKKCKELSEKNVELEKKNSKLQKDNCVLKKMLESSKSLNLCKDMKIQKLSTHTASLSTNNANTIQKQSKIKPVLFADYANHFSTAQLNDLRATDKGKRNDIKFVSKCLDFLYRGDKATIARKYPGNRKLKGKSMITPKKKTLMGQILDERIESEGVDEEIFIERSSRLNRLIGDGIYSLTKRQEPVEITPAPVNATENFTLQTTTDDGQSMNQTLQKTTFAGQTMNQTPQTVIITPHTFDAFNYVHIPYFN